jgi:hypothetical protein
MEDRNNVQAYSVYIFASRTRLMEMDSYTQTAKTVSDIRLCWRSGGTVCVQVESFIRLL